VSLTRSTHSREPAWWHAVRIRPTAAIKGLSVPTVAGFQPELADRVFRQFERLLGP
jgi:hypothetical protein